MDNIIDIVIRIPEKQYDMIKKYKRPLTWSDHLIAKGTLIPKGHGKIVDIGKIDEDRIGPDNPIISLTIGGECIEAVSLDYLDSLQTIIEADK